MGWAESSAPLLLEKDVRIAKLEAELAEARKGFAGLVAHHEDVCRVHNEESTKAQKHWRTEVERLRGLLVRWLRRHKILGDQPDYDDLILPVDTRAALEETT